jgi:hypothetical protein
MTRGKIAAEGYLGPAAFAVCELKQVLSTAYHERRGDTRDRAEEPKANRTMFRFAQHDKSLGFNLEIDMCGAERRTNEKRLAAEGPCEPWMDYCFSFTAEFLP